VPCILITGGLRVFGEVIFEAERSGLPVLRTLAATPVAMTKVTAILEDSFVVRELLHGVLLDILGLGVLIVGESGIGKSECALDLVMRGHRLVADDVIECDYRPPGMIFGEAAELLRYHIEVRGLGILNIKDLYGVTAVRERKRIDLVVRLELTQVGREYDRIGLEERHHEILGVPVREVCLPVQPGRNMSSIIEIAARNELLRQAGHDAARDLVQTLDRLAAGQGTTTAPPPRSAGVPRGQRTNESAAPPPAVARKKP
jgi:HPr kinase/phosphorylase